ncbi:MAG TPA: hypothetical protein VHV74_19730 [Pseudonocardiaceae bacterium]|nr:hypothetical protein [Pseudonocardiaceae bacterium]
MPPESTLSRDAVLARCRDALGPCEFAADLSTSHGEALTLEIDAGGIRWIAKHLRRRKKYLQELTAYRDWVPALGASAPALHSAHDDVRLLIISRLPGGPAEGTPAADDPRTHHRAGALTRLLHDGVPPVLVDFAQELRRRLDDYAERGRHVLTGDEIDTARAYAARLTGTAPTPAVPCHLDNQPRNWLVGPDGEIALIDFGNAKRQPWITDVSAIRQREWRERPDLEHAFFAGYGRQPDAADRRLADGHLAYLGIATIVWALDHDDPAFADQGRAWLRDLAHRSG